MNAKLKTKEKNKWNIKNENFVEMFKIFAMYQTTDVLPFVPVTAIHFDGNLLYKFLNSNSVSWLILDTINWGIDSDLKYLLE